MIKKETLDKYIPLLTTERPSMEQEMRDSEAIQVVLHTFDNYLSSIRFPRYDSDVILTNIGTHLVLFERLARQEEKDSLEKELKLEKEKAAVQVEATAIFQRKINKDNFKYSLMFLADEYVKDKQDRNLLKKIINRIN